jgi:hypothetical protein
MPSIRYHVTPRYAPPAIAARKLGLTVAEFQAKLPELLKRGFPVPDPTTKMFDLAAIDRWQDLRHGKLLAGDETSGTAAADARLVVRDRLRNPESFAAQITPSESTYESKTYASIVKNKPLGKLERMALKGYFDGKGQRVHVNGAGVDTQGRLEARGFIERPEGDYGHHSITPAGEAEWLRTSCDRDDGGGTELNHTRRGTSRDEW